jgi:isoleucyl-tRNA synthetase
MQDAKKQPLVYDVVKKIQGSELVGLRYEPLFENRGPNAHKVLHAEFVTTADGTGIVHEAPAYGEEDYELCKANGISSVFPLSTLTVHYTEGPLAGRKYLGGQQADRQDAGRRGQRRSRSNIRAARVPALPPLRHQTHVPGAPQLVYGHTGSEK